MIMGRDLTEGLTIQSLRTAKIDGTMKRWKPIRKRRRNATAIATRKRCGCCIPKRSLPTAVEKPERRRHTKCPCFSSPLSSNEEIETGNESDFSDFTPSKPPRSNLCPVSRTTVIYERQRWEGNTINERNVKQGRGRPWKEYLIQWTSSWVDGGQLTAPGLL